VWFLTEIAGLYLKVDRHAVILVERTGKPKPQAPSPATRKAKGERRGINIVKIPRRGLEDAAVSLRLNAVPLGEAIKYTCALADYSITIQKGAVVVYQTPERADP
jgi:hypothetical protein